MAKDSWLEEIAKDLLTLEINTVLKPSITARKMPPLPVAILEIAGKYYWYLRSLNEKRELSGVNAQLERLAPETRTNGVASFEALREASMLMMNQVEFKPDQVALLDRIYKISSAMPSIIKELTTRNERLQVWNKTMATLLKDRAALRGLKTRPEEITFIRKAWEIGVEDVVAQTVIHLDGDVITRLHPALSAPEAEALRQMHLASTRLSIETWNTVVKLVLSLISGALSALGRVLRVG